VKHFLLRDSTLARELYHHWSRSSLRVQYNVKRSSLPIANSKLSTYLMRIGIDDTNTKEDRLTIMNFRSTKETLFYSGSIRLDLGVVLRGCADFRCFVFSLEIKKGVKN